MINWILDLPRWIIAGLSSFLLIVLMIFSSLEGSKLQNELTNRLNNPTNYKQREIRLGFLKIDKVSDYEIIAHDSHRYYHLISEFSTHIREGETYSFIGSILKSGKINIQKMQHHPYRFYKYIISGSAIFIVLFLIFKNIRIRKNGWLTLIE
jgi:hypothetical protein